VEREFQLNKVKFVIFSDKLNKHIIYCKPRTSENVCIVARNDGLMPELLRLYNTCCIDPIHNLHMPVLNVVLKRIFFTQNIRNTSAYRIIYKVFFPYNDMCYFVLMRIIQ